MSPKQDVLNQILYWSIQYGINSLARFLIANKFPNKDIWPTTLFLAIMYGELDITEQLIAHGADPNSGTRNLYWATHNNNLEMARLLIINGANVNFDKYKLFWAACHNNLELAQLLVESGANQEQIDYALDEGCDLGNNIVIDYLASLKSI